MKCRICSNESDNQTFTAREMMFGYRDTFTYLECGSCGCLQLADPPADMKKYYPETYYSFSADDENPGSKGKELIKRARNRYAVTGKGLLGKWLYNRYPQETLWSIGRAGPQKNDAILDVGCGHGTYLKILHRLGYRRLTGVDPYIETDLEPRAGVRIQKKFLHEVNGEWDLIMLHHSFEHMPDPAGAMAQLARLLTDTGLALINIPSASSHAWKTYRENWVQLDAPRHYFLHSDQSLRLLAERAGLKIRHIENISTDFQFWGSEQYKRDIPLTSDQSHAKNPTSSPFMDREITRFRDLARQYNQQNEGDTKAYYLEKI